MRPPGFLDAHFVRSFLDDTNQQLIASMRAGERVGIVPIHTAELGKGADGGFVTGAGDDLDGML